MTHSGQITKSFKVMALTALLVTCSYWSVANAGQGSSMAKAAPGNVVEVAIGAGSFNTLVAAIKAAGLVDALQAKGPFTVFAPTDAAVAALPAGTLDSLLKPENKDKLVRILSLHVIPGKAMDQNSLKRVRSVGTVGGEDLRTALVRGRLRVNDARITADVDASNGVIHAIDRVLIPN